MTQARIYAFSDAQDRRQATIEVRDRIAEYLVNVTDNHNLLPEDIRGGAGFYRVSSTGGYQLTDRPYEDVHRFIEQLGVGESGIHRIAKFEQYEQMSGSEERDLILNSEDDVLSYVEDAMERVNELNVDEDNMSILGSQRNGLKIQVVPEDIVVSGVASDFGGNEFGDNRQVDGTWLVRSLTSFLDNWSNEQFEGTNQYIYDCSNEKPKHLDISDIEDRNGFIVTVGTKY